MAELRTYSLSLNFALFNITPDRLSTIVSSSTIYDSRSEDGSRLIFFGKNFSYNRSGDPIGGTVETLYYLEMGKKIFSIKHLEISLYEFIEVSERYNSAVIFPVSFDLFESMFITNDKFIGGTAADEFYAGTGNDTVVGNGGDDDLGGEEGDDYLSGGIGNDFLGGGAGSDKLEGGDGADTIYGHSQFADYEPDRADLINGGGGNDKLYGDGGDDRILGGAGADIIHGDDGNDIVDGGNGADQLFGGKGRDTFIIDNVGDRIQPDDDSENSDYDAVYCDISYKLPIYAAVDTLVASDKKSKVPINLTGNSFDQTVRGNAGSNTLDGAGSNDTLIGLGGKDLFILHNDFSIINLPDFRVGEDKMLLNAIEFIGLDRISSTFSVENFKLTTTTAGKEEKILSQLDIDDRIIFDQDSKIIYFDQDGSGDEHSLSTLASFNRAVNISSTDFLVV